MSPAESTTATYHPDDTSHLTPDVHPPFDPETTQGQDHDLWGANTTTEVPGDGDGGGAWVPFAEPVPDWDSAKDDWGVWWYIHIYGVGTLFMISALYSIISIVLLYRLKKVTQRPYFLALNVLMLIFALERGIFMFLDAYNAKGTLHPSLAYLFLSIGLPCMTSSLYLIFQAYAKITRMKLTRAIHKVHTMVIIIVAHFVISLSLDIAAGYTLHAVELLITCQAIFVIWGYTLCFLFLNLFKKLYHATVTSRRKIIRMSSGKPTSASVYGDSSNKDSVKKKADSRKQRIAKRNSGTSGISTTSSLLPEPKLIMGAKLILASACLLFIIATLYLGGLLGCYLLDIVFDKSPEPWPWWGYELAVRMCELGLCWTISLAGTQPIARRVQKRWGKRGSMTSHTDSSIYFTRKPDKLSFV